MRLEMRWSLIGIGILCFVVGWALSATGGATSLAEGVAEAEAAAPTQEPGADLESLEEALFEPEGPGRVEMTHEGCHAKVVCFDGSVAECEGGPGESCSTGTESCDAGASCTSGSQEFALCGSTKVTCPCQGENCDPCAGSSCSPGQPCRSHFDCGPCGACSSGACVCLKVD